MRPGGAACWFSGPQGNHLLQQPIQFFHRNILIWIDKENFHPGSFFQKKIRVIDQLAVYNTEVAHLNLGLKTGTRHIYTILFAGMNAGTQQQSWTFGGGLGAAGGVRAPITHDADNVELIRRIQPHHVLLVADAGLGTLNQVRMSLEALSGQRVTALLNRFDVGNDLHRRNREWLAVRDGATVITSVDEWWSVDRR